MAALRRAAVLAVLCGLLAACGGSGSADRASTTQPTLRFGYAFSPDAGDVGDRVALDRVATEDGIRSRYVQTGSPANAVAALVRGDVDFANLPYKMVLEAIGQGAPLEAVLASNMASEHLLVARPGIASIPALAGKRVAISGPGQESETDFRLTLKRGGLDPDRVHYSALQDSPARAAALQAGRIDATMLEIVDYNRLKQRMPGLVLLGHLNAVRPAGPFSVWAVKRGWAAKHPDVLRKLVSGLLAGYEFVYTPAGRAAWIKRADATALEGDPEALVAGTYDAYRGLSFWPHRDRPLTKAMYDERLRFYEDTGQLEGASVPFAAMWNVAPWRLAAAGS